MPVLRGCPREVEHQRQAGFRSNGKPSSPGGQGFQDPVIAPLEVAARLGVNIMGDPTRPEPPDTAQPPVMTKYAAVQALPQRSIHPQQRDAFLKALASKLERHPVVGPGLVHRLAADVQRRYVIAPER